MKKYNTEGISNILGRFLREEGLEMPSVLYFFMCL